MARQRPIVQSGFVPAESTRTSRRERDVVNITTTNTTKQTSSCERHAPDKVLGSASGVGLNPVAGKRRTGPPQHEQQQLEVVTDDEDACEQRAGTAKTIDTTGVLAVTRRSGRRRGRRVAMWRYSRSASSL